MGTAYIGSVNLRYPLSWEKKPTRVMGAGKIGADVRSITGSMIFQRAATSIVGSSQPMEVTLHFNWESQATIEALDALWRAGNIVNCDFEGNGNVWRFRFAAEDGITDADNVAFGNNTIHSFVSGEDTDIYSGKIHGYVISALTTTTTTTSTSSTTTTSTSTTSTTTTGLPPA